LSLRLCLFVAFASAAGCRSSNGDGARPPASVQAPTTSQRLPAESTPNERARSTARGATPSPSASEGPTAGAADTDPNNDAIVAPPDVIDGCEQALEQAKVAYRPATLPLRTQRSGAQCGAPQVVIYERGPADIRYDNPPLLTCGMALALSRFERVVQEEAERIFGLRVTRIRQMGTYACRKMVRFRMLSEHSYANAIDLEKFVLADRRVISVKEHYGGAQTDTAESRFLRTIARRAYDDAIFSVALGPPWDKLHSNHLHFDLARYRVDGTRW